MKHRFHSIVYKSIALLSTMYRFINIYKQILNSYVTLTTFIWIEFFSFGELQNYLKRSFLDEFSIPFLFRLFILLSCIF